MAQANAQTPLWPAVSYERLLWEPALESRLSPATATPRTYHAAVPAQIAKLSPSPAPHSVELAIEAEQALTRFDTEHGTKLRGFAPLLLRSESAASSQIENLTASARQIFTAEITSRGPRNSEQIAANTRMMVQAIDSVDTVSATAILLMHEVLLRDDPRHTPGQMRDEPVWIGKSSLSPVGAEYVAPHHRHLDELLKDLTTFCKRRDISPLVHVAIAHAQFETIHPFSDGNGRVGRVLVQIMLRNSGVARTVSVPVSAGLLARVDDYYDALTRYREGEIDPIIEQFASASLRAIPNAETLIADLGLVANAWAETARPRQNSAKAKLLEYAARQPVFTAQMAADAATVPVTNIYRDLAALEEVHVLRSVKEHRGPRLWRAPAILHAIDEFARRAEHRTTTR